MNEQTAKRLGTAAKIVGWGLALILLLAALFTGLWILFAGALIVAFGTWAHAPGRRGLGEGGD